MYSSLPVLYVPSFFVPSRFSQWLVYWAFHIFIFSGGSDDTHVQPQFWFNLHESLVALSFAGQFALLNTVVSDDQRYVP